MNFIAIDFETANSSRGSACEIGIAKVENYKIVEEKSFLIRPKENYFDWYNTHLHGIDEQTVANEPEFDEIYDNLRDDFASFPVIAHNAGFDISVLRHTLDQYNIDYPVTKYSCTYQMVREHLPQLFSFRLDAVCKHYGIPLIHHRALPDAIACANLAIKLFEERKVRSFDAIEDHFDLKVGSLHSGGYKPSLKRSSSNGYKISDIAYDPSKVDVSNVFYGRSLCFTGTLSSMVRVDAQRMILEVGGSVTKGVTKETNFLVVGEQDYKQYGNGFKSSKMKRAEKYLMDGQSIELITEKQFLELIGN